MSTPADTLTGSAPVPIESDLLPTDNHYRLTGELPTPTEESAASDQELEKQEQEIARDHEAMLRGEETPELEESATSPRDTAAEPRTAPTQKKTESRSERRFREITRENRDLRERLDAIERRSAIPTAETRETPTSQPAAAKAETATRQKPKIDDIDPATNRQKFTTLEQFQDARDEWNRAETLAEIETRNRKANDERTQSDQQRQQAEAERVIGEELGRKFQEARKKYPDFDAVALNQDPTQGEVLRIPKGSVADIFLIRSPHAAEVLYHLGQHPEILEEFYGDKLDAKGNFVNKLDPMGQHEKLLEIQREVTAAAVKPAPKPPARRVTNAPPPPHEVLGKNTTSMDEVEQAVNDGDMAAYKERMNARDRQKHSRRGR